MGKDWSQYEEKPTGGTNWDQYAEAPSAPVSGVPEGTIQAAPPSGVTHPINWLTNAMGDIEQGGGSTWLGKLYKAAGGQPLQAGAGGGNAAAPINRAPMGTPASVLGGPAVGPLQATRGALEVGSGHPIVGANDVIGGVARTVAPVAAVTQPELLPVAAAAVPAQMGASKVASTAGLSPQAAQLVGNIAAIGAGAKLAGSLSPTAAPNPQGARSNLALAINPSKVQSASFLKAVDGLPDSALEDIAKQNPQTTSALADALVTKQKALEAKFQQAKAPIANNPVDLTPIADAMEARITPGMKFKYPELAKQIQQEAAQYRGKTVDINTLDSIRDTINSDLTGQYKARGLNLADAKKSPQYSYRFAEGEAARDLLYNEMEKATGQDLSSLKMQQSNIRRLQDILGDNAAQARVADMKDAATPNSVKVGNALLTVGDLKPGTAVKQLIKSYASRSKQANQAVQRFSDKAQ